MQCEAIHTFSPRCCAPNKFSLPCRKHSLMCCYFHSNSRLLSSASTSHVYESVHLPGGLRTSPVPPHRTPPRPPLHPPLPQLFFLRLSTDTSLNVSYLQGQKTGTVEHRGGSIAFFLFLSFLTRQQPSRDTKANNGELKC